MKTNRIVLKALAAAVLASTAGLVAAAGTQTVPVNAVVKQVCKFDGAAAAIDFGTLDPNVDTGVKTAAVSVPYKCTKGFTPTVTKGTIVPLTSGANTMAFTVDDFTEAAGTGFSAAVNATSTARIVETEYKDAAAGTYVGSIVVDINGGD
jgi:hypothetical protein